MWWNMAFRADEAARAGFDHAVQYLVPRARDMDESGREHSKKALLEIIDEIGPVVDSYPSWHPLVRNYENHANPSTFPDGSCGYVGLDHTILFAHGFITCPYSDGQDVIDSVEKLPSRFPADILAERLDVKLYNPNTTAVLVRCAWERPLDADKTIPLSLAMPLLLEKELPCWKSAEIAETWETMRLYFLGLPHGSRSSLFVSQATGQAMKKVWESLIHTGMFGPILARK